MKGPPLTDPAAFLTPTDQLLPLVAYFGKAMDEKLASMGGAQ